MKDARTDFFLAATGGAVGYSGTVITQFNAIVGTATVLIGLLGAALGLINGWYAWKRNRREAREQKRRDDAEMNEVAHRTIEGPDSHRGDTR